MARVIVSFPACRFATQLLTTGKTKPSGTVKVLTRHGQGQHNARKNVLSQGFELEGTASMSFAVGTR